MFNYIFIKSFLKKATFSVELINFLFLMFFGGFLWHLHEHKILTLKQELWVSDIFFNKVFDWYFDVYYSFFIFKYLKFLEKVYYNMDKGLLEFFGPLGIYYIILFLENFFVNFLLKGFPQQYVIIMLFNFFIINSFLIINFLF